MVRNVGFISLTHDSLFIKPEKNSAKLKSHRDFIGIRKGIFHQTCMHTKLLPTKRRWKKRSWKKVHATYATLLLFFESPENRTIFLSLFPLLQEPIRNRKKIHRESNYKIPSWFTLPAIGNEVDELSVNTFSFPIRMLFYDGSKRKTMTIASDKKGVNWPVQGFAYSWNLPWQYP